MKKLFVFLLFLGVVNLYGEETKLSPQQILKKSIDISSPDTMYSLTKQVVYTYTGKKRVFEVKSWSKGKNEKILFEYVKPARVKGDKFLFLKGGDIWAYFSKTGRVRRIASSAKKSKMQGSDFSYEDVSMMSSLEKDFKAKIIKEEKFDGDKCYVLQLIPVKKDISYNKLIAYIKKDDFTLRKVNFFKNNKLIKFMIQKDYKKVNGFYVPFITIMKSVKNDTKTESIIKKVKVNIKIPDKKFNKNNF